RRAHRPGLSRHGRPDHRRDRRARAQTGRLGIRQHLANRVARYVEMLRCLALAHAFRARQTNPQVKFHGVNPSSLLARIAKREKVDDFYAARSSTSPPLPWSNFAPPFSMLVVQVDKPEHAMLLAVEG